MSIVHNVSLSSSEMHSPLCPVWRHDAQVTVLQEKHSIESFRTFVLTSAAMLPMSSPHSTCEQNIGSGTVRAFIIVAYLFDKRSLAVVNRCMIGIGMGFEQQV